MCTPATIRIPRTAPSSSPVFLITTRAPRSVAQLTHTGLSNSFVSDEEIGACSFPRPRCCPRFKNVVLENRTECACSFFPIFSGEVFLPVSQKRPIRTSVEEIGACSHGIIGLRSTARVFQWLRNEGDVGSQLWLPYKRCHEPAWHVLPAVFHELLRIWILVNKINNDSNVNTPWP